MQGAQFSIAGTVSTSSSLTAEGTYGFQAHNIYVSNDGPAAADLYINTVTSSGTTVGTANLIAIAANTTEHYQISSGYWSGFSVAATSAVDFRVAALP